MHSRDPRAKPILLRCCRLRTHEYVLIKKSLNTALNFRSFAHTTREHTQHKHTLTCSGVPSNKILINFFINGTVDNNTRILKPKVHRGSMICHVGLYQITAPVEHQTELINGYQSRIKSEIMKIWKEVKMKKCKMSSQDKSSSQAMAHSSSNQQTIQIKFLLI